MHEERSATGRRRVYHLLDAIRGIAAIIVMQRHSDALLAWVPIKASFLAVDLFYVLSGFVIAFAYEQRLIEGASPWRFMALRFVRLYPLYLIGIALGFVQLLGRISHPGAGLPPVIVAGSVLFALLMLPPWGVPPLVGPRWSLTYELVANAIYGGLARWLSARMLFAVSVGSGLGLLVALVRGQPLDSGWAFSDADVGLARVGYSFFVGVLCYHLHLGRLRRRMLFGWLAFAVVGVAGAVLLLPARLAAEYALVLAGFPLLVVGAARYDVPAAAAKVCAFLGVASYAIYVIHQPASLLFEAAMHRVGVDPAEHGALPGLVFVLCMLALSWMLDRWYDKPVRRWLTAKVGPLRPPARSGAREGLLDPASAGLAAGDAG